MTTKWRTEKPSADEHAPFYAGYIAEAPGADVLGALEQQATEIPAFVRGIPGAKGDHRYAEGKWSVKDVVLHICDAERVFSYRLLRISRNDQTDLPGFDENLFVMNAGAGSHTLAQLADQFAAVRRSTLALLAPMQDDQMTRRGTANGNPISARAIAWILAGHADHHVRVIRERYL